MKSIYEKLRTARVELGFSQGYVAECLGIGRSTMTQIELGNRKISADELENSASSIIYQRIICLIPK